MADGEGSGCSGWQSLRSRSSNFSQHDIETLLQNDKSDWDIETLLQNDELDLDISGESSDSGFEVSEVEYVEGTSDSSEEESTDDDVSTRPKRCRTQEPLFTWTDLPATSQHLDQSDMINMATHFEDLRVHVNYTATVGVKLCRLRENIFFDFRKLKKNGAVLIPANIGMSLKISLLPDFIVALQSVMDGGKNSTAGPCDIASKKDSVIFTKGDKKYVLTMDECEFVIIALEELSAYLL